MTIMLLVTKLWRPLPVWEAVAFSIAVILYIWLRSIPAYWVGLLLGAVAFSFWKRSQTAESLGLGWQQTRSTLRTWWPAWLVLAPAVIWLGWEQVTVVTGRTLIYLAWCIVQQLVYQNMVAERLRQGGVTSWLSRTISGAFFATAHLPNPVLTPATFIWGAISSYLYEFFPSVIALGLLQFLLSTLVYVLTPIAWNHGMRVGPGYWRVH